MALELDHVFLCVDEPLRAEAELAAFGLDLSTRGLHSGQGTRNACAFFDNAYLELLQRHDDLELRSPVVEPLMLWERLRWRETGACPFGVAFRSAQGGSDGTGIETWDYAAPYLPPGTAIAIVTPRRSPAQPLVFLLPDSISPERVPSHRRPPLEQRGSRRRLTGVTLRLPAAATLTAATRETCTRHGVEIAGAEAPHLELEWDHGGEGSRADFSNLPFSIRW